MEVSFLADYPQYAEQIAHWYFEQWGYLVPEITIGTVKENVLRKAQSRNDIPLIFVIHQQDKPIGAIELKYRENANHPDYEHWIGGVYVSPEFRGKGVAGHLLETAKKHARQLGLTKLYLQCEDDYIGLYRKYGFHALHRTNHGVMSTTVMLWNVCEEKNDKTAEHDDA
ncbi:Acetyltransferase (GNAT) family protein [Vibrio aerogenes CECT 7868]|uniref:Acetyltransferase (GNAT) family protein n=1 Tax=Vibrio aerogenes CECT 7868 TaxID=1216006 RepID=A0A1M5UZ75_9VIBR|nr:GNAT family N-acetyltransferase [Vibrio aerogenes]SHH68302.1 Acetyltransferase (GNAT) family protein [Vibrio aerogenes CECT 7868]